MRRYKLRTASLLDVGAAVATARGLASRIAGLEPPSIEGMELPEARATLLEHQAKVDVVRAAQAHAANAVLSPWWRVRASKNVYGKANVWPPHSDIEAWRGLGASHAMLYTPTRVLFDASLPHERAYIAAYQAVLGAYMTTAPEVSTTLDIPKDGIPPALAEAWVRAAKNAPVLERDATNDRTGHYTSADGVARQSRTTLANEGLLWSIVGDRLMPRSLDACTIGNGQHYVGDVSLDWMLVHTSGAVLRGTSTAAVVAMPATPHDKAVQAAKTYLSGNVLRGLLCFVREDKHSTDKRLDREAAEPETCSPEIIAEVAKLTDWMSEARSRSTGRTVRGREVFAAAWKGCALQPDDNVRPSNMNPGEGHLVVCWLRETKSKMERKTASATALGTRIDRQPGEDDPADVEPPADWTGHSEHDAMSHDDEDRVAT